MTVKVMTGDCLDVLRTLPAESVQCCVTSPPYFGLRDYGHAGQIGLEPTPDAYVAKLVEVFREVRRVLADDGTVWLNLGDSYANDTKWGGSSSGKHVAALHGDSGIGRGRRFTGAKAKDLLGIPWRVAFALQADGWYLRSDIIWHKPNPMPESVTDRPTKAHEYLFLLAKQERYYYDAAAVGEPFADERKGASGTKTLAYSEGSGRNDTLGSDEKPGLGVTPINEYRNRRTVWTVATQPYSGAHFATMPPHLIEPCILAGCPPQGRRCDCDAMIDTPTGSGAIDDPSMLTGRAGMNRPRRDDEGTRPITRRQQRSDAAQIRESIHRAAIQVLCGQAFDHYIRTDASGARPLPPRLRADFLRRRWIVEPDACRHPIEPAGTVLDPFGGAGTTGLVADRLQRNALLIELNPEYATMARNRIYGDAPLFADVS